MNDLTCADKRQEIVYQDYFITRMSTANMYCANDRNATNTLYVNSFFIIVIVRMPATRLLNHLIILLDLRH